MAANTNVLLTMLLEDNMFINELSTLELFNLSTYISKLSHEQSVSNELFIYSII